MAIKQNATKAASLGLIVNTHYYKIHPLSFRRFAHHIQHAAEPPVYPKQISDILRVPCPHKFNKH